MQVQQKGITTAKSAKDYLSKNEIPQLFECLMTGLMYHRPVDYIDYLQECLEKIKKQGINAVHWDMFLESKKTPLPPIVATPKEDFRPEPLPEIGSYKVAISPTATIIILQGGPGIGKFDICRKLSVAFSELCHIHIGSLIRERAQQEAKNGKSKWKNVVDSINEGDFAPEDLALEILIKELNNNADRDYFLIDGYPRTAQEKSDFEKFIGFAKVKFMVLVDCEEEICERYLMSQPRNQDWKDNSTVAISKRITNYKANTLAVCKSFDDQGKLIVIDGDNESSIVYREIEHLFNKQLRGLVSPDGSPRPDSARSGIGSPGPKATDEITELTGIAIECERNSELPQCSIIILLGGPGSGKTEIATFLCQKYSGWVHVDINELLRSQVINNNQPNNSVAQISSDGNDKLVESWSVNIHAVKEALKNVQSDAQVIVVEGFPKNQEELNQLNTEIGKTDLVILLDSEEDVMKSRLAERYSQIGNVEDDEFNSDMRINYFKEHGLPLCRYYDERCHLKIVNSDKDVLYVIEEMENFTAHLLTARNNSNAASEDQNDNKADESEDKTAIAAITIQASIRGHLTRKQLKRDRENNDIVENEIVDEQITDNIEEIEQVDNNQQHPLEQIAGVRTSSQMDIEEANIILLLGGPGSGKKSLGDQLVNKYGFSFVHVDQLISNEINSFSDQADALNQCIESNYEDITPILILLRKHIARSLEMSKTIIVAGFFKTSDQYRLFEEEVGRISNVIYLDVDPDTLKSRLESEEDPDFSNIISQIEEFQETRAGFIEDLSSADIFNQINGSGSIEEVLAEACAVIDEYPFMKMEE